MEWARLLSSKRLHAAAAPQAERSNFQRDFDRIVFSAAFRRLQDKTQVHPFPESDYVRRRLTHSLEVSCVGRSLGTALGQHLVDTQADLKALSETLPVTMGQVVANACLAHDIGNPPFGHAGEKAIGSWFQESLPTTFADALSPLQKADLHKFEGNAQGFRLLTRLQDNRDAGGLRLTYATLGAFTKYPSTSLEAGGSNYVGAKKHGFFGEDVSAYSLIANELGIPRQEVGWSRHPLVFLVEAADDICYRIIDVEDAFKLSRITFAEAEERLLAILPNEDAYQPVSDESDNIGWLRAHAIGTLIRQVSATATERLTGLMDGSYSLSLIDDIPSAPEVKRAYDLVRHRVFSWDRTVAAEIAGAQMIRDVLGKLVLAAVQPDLYTNRMLLKIVPRYDATAAPYAKLLSITDYVSGMTDSYLQRIHRRLTGQAVS